MQPQASSNNLVDLDSHELDLLRAAATQVVRNLIPAPLMMQELNDKVKVRRYLLKNLEEYQNLWNPCRQLNFSHTICVHVFRASKIL